MGLLENLIDDARRVKRDEKYQEALKENINGSLNK